MKTSMDWHSKPPKKLIDREKKIIELCEDKRVLSLGCIDHPLLDYRISSGTWLHGKLIGAAKELVGVDNARDDIEYLKKTYKIDNIICGDVENIHSLGLPPFDVVVAGSIIEHLNNPGLFLQGAKGLISANGILVITTINAFCFRRIIRMMTGIESVHPDHKCYFSHSTLTRLLTSFGYGIKEKYNYRLPKEPPWAPYFFESAASAPFPQMCEGLFYIVEVRR